jgi:hypothetical protein
VGRPVAAQVKLLAPEEPAASTGTGRLWRWSGCR